MASICSSCQILSRGLLFGRRPVGERLFSTSTWKTSWAFGRVKKKHCSGLISSVKLPVIEASSRRSLFISSRRLDNDERDPAGKRLEEEGPTASPSSSYSGGDGDGLSGRIQNQAEEEREQSYEDSLTEDELTVLREIEEEERRLREGGSPPSPGNLKSYNIWEDDSEAGGVEEGGRRRLTGSLSESHVPFQNQRRIIQDVIDEMWNPQPEFEEEEELPQIYPRGKTGVFDLGELVDLLREEHAEEMVVIKIPAEFDYADSMVIVTVRNNRHLLALATFVRKRFKMKQRKRTDKIPFLEKHRNHKGWIALDLGNIIFHVMLQEVRDYYDLEMLWTVGPNYDDLTHAKDPEIVQLLNTLK